MERRVITLLVATMLIASCTGTTTPGSRASSEESPSPWRLPNLGFVRRCATSVYGDLGRNWRRRAVVSGPLALIPTGYPKADSSVFDSGIAAKFLAIVRNPSVVALRVPRAERDHVALVYDPADFNRHLRPAQADPVVTFRACPLASGLARGKDTQFNGGLLVTRPSCVRLDVVSGSTKQRSLLLPMGSVSCDH